MRLRAVCAMGVALLVCACSKTLDLRAPHVREQAQSLVVALRSGALPAAVEEIRMESK